MKVLTAAVAGLALFTFANVQAAYPDRPIKMIVPWAAGGDTDNIFRPFAPALQKALGGTTVVIANIGGASGTVGAREAKGSPADGYTLYAVHDYIHLTYYTGMSDVSYADFEPVCLIAATPSILTASPKTKWNTMKEMVADAKANPGQISVGATLGSTSHFFPAMVEKAAGIKFKYISYDGLAQRMNAILGGHIDLTDGNLTQKGKVDAAQLKFLAIATEKRSPELPNVPTLKELGYNVIYSVSRGLLAPKGTPADVLSKLEGACGQAAKDPTFAESMRKQGTDVHYLDHKGYAEFLKQNDALNKDLSRDLGLLKR
ncbi:MAG: tripartite tricarboxylate transporter substrate binding protein [Betaproteobacteria bacterium]|nr:MAG: tripartite tricarboxylate transporter substrate binding protein [Betaproteobacteria bacterium]